MSWYSDIRDIKCKINFFANIPNRLEFTSRLGHQINRFSNKMSSEWAWTHFRFIMKQYHANCSIKKNRRLNYVFRCTAKYRLKCFKEVINIVSVLNFWNLKCQCVWVDDIYAHCHNYTTIVENHTLNAHIFEVKRGYLTSNLKKRA